MKQLFLIAAIIFSVTVNAQVKEAGKSESPKVSKTDSMPGNDVGIVSIKQMNEVLAMMRKEMTIEEAPLFELIKNKMQAVVNEAILEWRKKKK